MSALLLKGAPAAAALLEKLESRIANLARRGVVPALAILSVGERPDDRAYARSVRAKAEGLGIRVRETCLAEGTHAEVFFARVEALNQDAAVHGVLCMRPLPPAYSEERLAALLAPAKDVDGLSWRSMAALYAGAGAGGQAPACFAPCTARACVELLDHYGIPLEGKHAVIIGRSLVVGRPLAMLLLARGATVTLCHSRTERPRELCRAADIVVAALGRAGFVDSGFLRAGQVVLDAGINVRSGGGIAGDVDGPAAAALVDALSPVPGGVGAVTTAVLLSQIVEAAEHHHD
ncbi:MAG: bifunctional 5,10-methylenetetrahydrofolate dehydrogenase/5,10-methenyltetrahydrofolate cyclohydrolase [Treponema sp.]|jgi:methylenetetrahydrofolate dehydrogenase (NADP+)/methenyltetrahydrofolate cyclohydrolase|nr:bifunctional 5,10-methylenetetrahydrofolate dehydrogenase/5,10-methenyltetrahydrofolate cyclohydrolase [Treponema sp.]